jgi:hypothetical protein
MTPELLAALAERAGLKLSSQQLKEISETFPRVEAMMERVRRGGTRPVEAEPATIFAPLGKLS